MQFQRAITRELLKTRARCLHQPGGFRGRPIEWCHCCHGNQPLLFKHKIDNNSAGMGDRLLPRFLDGFVDLDNPQYWWFGAGIHNGWAAIYSIYTVSEKKEPIVF